MNVRLRAIVVIVMLIGLTGCAGIIRDRIFQPEPVGNTPVTFGAQAPETLTATTADGLTLTGYYWPPALDSDTLLVAFHGNGANQLVNAARFEAFRKGGHGVLIASYRGYGGNPGRPSEAGLMLDGDAWIARASVLAPGARRFVFGHSLGGAVALAMAGRHQVEGVATLGTFSSMTAMVPGIARGSLRDRFDSEAAIARVTAPVWLYHGTADEVVPFAMAEALRRASGGRASVVPLEGGGHQVPMDRFAELMWRNFSAAR